MAKRRATVGVGDAIWHLRSRFECQWDGERALYRSGGGGGGCFRAEARQGGWSRGGRGGRGGGRSGMRAAGGSSQGQIRLHQITYQRVSDYGKVSYSYEPQVRYSVSRGYTYGRTKIYFLYVFNLPDHPDVNTTVRVRVIKSLMYGYSKDYAGSHRVLLLRYSTV